MRERAKDVRRAGQADLEAVPGSREVLEATHGEVWDTRGLARHFIVVGVVAPLLLVRRKADGVTGSLKIQSRPMLYYDFRPDERTGPAGE